MSLFYYHFIPLEVYFVVSYVRRWHINLFVMCCPPCGQKWYCCMECRLNTVNTVIAFFVFLKWSHICWSYLFKCLGALLCCSREIGHCFDCRNVSQNTAKCHQQTSLYPSLCLSDPTPAHTHIKHTNTQRYFLFVLKPSQHSSPEESKAFFLNPPAAEKSIMFCSPAVKRRWTGGSFIQFSQLNCTLVLIKGWSRLLNW